MKISKVIGYGLSSPVKGGHTYYGYQSDTKNIGIIEVHTECGMIGYGETYAGVYCAELIQPTVKYLESYLIGSQITNANILDSIPYIGRSGLIKCITSGIDIAIYDILSKAENKPLYEYLGGNYEIPTYASNGSAVFTPNQIEQDVKMILDNGYTAYKMRIGLQSRDIDLQRLHTARKHLGHHKLMVDAIMGTNPNKWDYKTARQWSKDLEEFDVCWLEEPFTPTDIPNYTNLCSNSNIPIAGGEALNQMLEFDLYKDMKAVDIIQPDVTNSGGIKECIAIVNKFGKQNTAMHVWGSRVAINANKHFAKAFDVSYLEVPMMELQINDEIQSDNIGIGIYISDKVKDKYMLNKSKNFKL
jgi:L-alanine-DL-glutamate epimerase-like enolase superfamily enzyme|tara:strand:- start:2572 stop:3645 length:1074 start_codon:yes stop_codon:yes gene_type:complete